MKIRFNHLEENKISYIDHLIQALDYSKDLMLASLYLIAHAIYPDIFECNASNIVKKCHTKMFSTSKDS